MRGIGETETEQMTREDGETAINAKRYALCALRYAFRRFRR